MKKTEPQKLKVRDFLGGHSSAVAEIVSNARSTQVSHKKSRIIVSYLRRRMLDDPDFFPNLSNLLHYKLRMKRFTGEVPKVGKVDVVVKYCFPLGDAREHGFDVNDYKRFYKAYLATLRNRRIRKPKNYLLVPLNAHGSFSLPYGPKGKVLDDSGINRQAGYLVMERLRKSRTSRKDGGLTEALDELQKHVNRVCTLHGFEKFDQKHHVLVLGRESKSGKWILALPHDYC